MFLGLFSEPRLVSNPWKCLHTCDFNGDFGKMVDFVDRRSLRESLPLGFHHH